MCKETVVKNEKTLEEIFNEIDRKAKNGEYNNHHEMTIELLNHIGERQNDIADKKRRKEIIVWLEMVIKSIEENTLKEPLMINEVLDKLDKNSSMTHQEVLNMINIMFAPESMPLVMQILSSLLEEKITTFIINPDEEQFFSLIHIINEDGIEQTSIVLELGLDKTNNVHVYANNFMQGFVAVFMLNQIVEFYYNNLSLEAINHNDVIKNLITNVLSDLNQ